jgi:hypothetical protein
LNAVAIGNTSTSSATQAHAVGYNITNTTANSLLVDCTANIRANANTCSLGTVAKPFGDVYLAGSIAGATNTRTADNIVSNAGTGVANNLPVFSSAKVLTDSGVALSSLSTTSAMTTADNLRVLKAGDTMTGALVNSLTTDSSSVSTGAITTAGGLGVTKKAYIGTNCVVGPVGAGAILENALTVKGSNASATVGPHIATYTATDQYPLFQLLSFQHGDVSLNFDMYNDGVGWKSSSSTAGNFQIYKTTNQVQFKYAASIAAGSAITFSTAGVISTSTGALQWSKPISTSDTTASTNTATGAITSAGGMSAAGAIYAGTSVNGATVVSSGAITAGTSLNGASVAATGIVSAGTTVNGTTGLQWNSTLIWPARPQWGQASASVTNASLCTDASGLVIGWNPAGLYPTVTIGGSDYLICLTKFNAGSTQNQTQFVNGGVAGTYDVTNGNNWLYVLGDVPSSRLTVYEFWVSSINSNIAIHCYFVVMYRGNSMLNWRVDRVY